MKSKYDIDGEKELVLTPYVIYHCEKKELLNTVDGQEVPYSQKIMELFHYCQEPKKESELVRLFGREMVDSVIKMHCIAEPEQIYKINKLLLIEIGITNYCNNKCVYCPVRDHPVTEKKVMDMALFNKIIDFAQSNGNPYLTLNFYNEPTLDPLFNERIEKIGQTDLHYTLQTNGSGLSDEKMDMMLKYEKNLHKLIINLPSIDSEVYQNMTGKPLTKQLLANVENAAKKSSKVQIVVIGTKIEIDQNMPAIQQSFSCDVLRTRAHDVAGAVNNEKYSEHTSVAGSFVGCPTVTQSININAFGDVFLCSRDFFQKSPIGNASKHHLGDILISPEAQRIREIVYGGCKGDYVCEKCAYMRFYQKGKKYRQVKTLLKETTVKDF